MFPVKLSALWLLGLAVVGLAIFGWYERGQGQLAALAVQRQQELARQADSLKLAISQRVARFAQDSQKQAQNALESTRRLQTTTRKADSLERALKNTPPMTARDTQALQVIAAKDSQLTAAQGVIQEDSVGIRQREAKIAFYRDTVVVRWAKSYDDVQKQLDNALTRLSKRWHFPCASAGGTANNKGFGFGLSLGVCYSL